MPEILSTGLVKRLGKAQSLSVITPHSAGAEAIASFTNTVRVEDRTRHIYGDTKLA